MARRFGSTAFIGVLLASTLVTVVASPAHATSFEDWANVDAGGNHSCGVRLNGKLYCWGYDGYGEVGDGDTNSAAVSVPLRIGSFEDWSNVTAGGNHSCGVRRNGKLYCWGSDGSGQVGDGGNPDPATAPRRIGTFEDWATASAGSSHTCGIRKNGKLYCWGNDGSGQIGDEDNPDPATAPRRVGTFEDWFRVSAGTAHTCGTRTNGKLYCWGNDGSGQIGDGNNPIPAIVPRRVGTFEDWATVSTGSNHTCGTRTNGKLYCWGGDFYGERGDGNNADPATTPRRIGTFEDWATVGVGSYHSCGVRRNGKLYCWGYDVYGQVGDDSNPDQATAPRRISIFEDWSTVSGGSYHSCGTRAHKLYCWGNDANGQIGDGDNPSKATVPRRI